MPRSPSRPTLKLPAKPALPSEASDPRLPSRKPVRSGFKAPKQTVAQHTRELEAKAARSAAEKESANDQRRAAPRFNPEAPRSPQHKTVLAKTEPIASAKETPPRQERQTPEVPKSYPKRGIARSTGARALPPTRSERERNLARPEAVTLRQPPAPPPPGATHRDAPPAAPAREPASARRPLNEPPRLSKRISEMAQCSRREADEWIENGWVRVDGAVVTTLGTRAHPNAKIEIAEESRKHQTESVTILLNKPLDMPSGSQEGDTALQLIRANNRWAEDDTKLAFKATHLRGLTLAGKLDPESTGMLVFTQEGSVARRIIGDETRLEKEYLVQVSGELTPEGLQKLNHGLSLDDVKLKRAQVSWQNEQQLRFVLHESRKRQIQRMCELVGIRVTGIKRIRIGSVSLGKLPAGQWRYLRENERF